jgi:hypothetical protein
MSNLPYRPGAALRTAWLALIAMFAAAIGALIAWYGGLLWLMASLGADDRAPGTRPPDLLRRLDGWLWPEVLAPLVLLGVATGLVLARRAAVRESSAQRWGGRRRCLIGGVTGAMVGTVMGFVLVGGWSIATVRLDGDQPPPSISDQSVDLGSGSAPCSLGATPTTVQRFGRARPDYAAPQARAELSGTRPDRACRPPAGAGSPPSGWHWGTVFVAQRLNGALCRLGHVRVGPDQ